VREAALTRFVDIYSAGARTVPGYYECCRCGSYLLLGTGGQLPRCPRCGSRDFAYTTVREPDGSLHRGVRFDGGGYLDAPRPDARPVEFKDFRVK